ncbi:MAG: aminotransferase class I/II-fold pyridoxal phosphate-dependent enzyme [Elusimicrobiota bacterium]
MIPISASKFSILSPLFSRGEIEEELSAYFNRKHCFLFSSGGEALTLILKILREKTGRDEVIMPAYNPNTVYVAIREAGCKVKFCDMSLASFNMDLEKLEENTTDNTLAIIAVHLFGNPENMEAVSEIAQKKGSYVIDDFCQAFGTKIDNGNVGSFGAVSVLSFGKGKNLTASDGGALFVDDEDIVDRVEKEYIQIKELSVFERFKLLAKAIALSILSRPMIYGLVRKLLSSFREVPSPAQIIFKPMSKAQKNLALNIFKTKAKNLNPRFVNGGLLYEFFKDSKEFLVPEISDKAHIVWNRFPVLVKDLSRKEVIKKRLLKAGIETNYLYGAPVFDQFEELELNREDYKNSIYMAERLLTLPVNCFVKLKHLKVIKECFQKEI